VFEQRRALHLALEHPAHEIATMTDLLPDGVEIEVLSRGNRWRLAWHPPTPVPEGKPDGSAGICVVASSEVVVISNDEISWDFPGGGRIKGDGGELKGAN
jgi:hypothetical protein